MDIQRIIEAKFEHKRNQHRMLTDQRSVGIFSCGFVKKNREKGSVHNCEKVHYDLLLILSGEGKYVDDEVGEIRLQAGDCVQRLPGRRHSTITLTDDWSELYLCIGANIFSSLAEVYGVNREKPVLSTGLDFDLIQLFLEIHDGLSNKTYNELAMLLPKAIELITRATYLDRQQSCMDDEAETLKLSVMYMREQLHQKLTIEEVATNVNMGYETYRKLFQKHYGISPGGFLLNEKMREAQRMLADKEATIKEVAVKLGYGDAYSFSKQFKKHSGYSPSHFRELYH